MSNTYGAPTNLDLSGCNVTATGGTTSQTIADLAKSVQDNASVIANTQNTISSVNTLANTANTNAASAQSTANTALTTAQTAQTAVGTPVQQSTAGKAGGYVAYDASSGNARIEAITPATPWQPTSACLNMNPTAVSTASSFSQFIINASDGSANTVSSLINCGVDSQTKKNNFSFNNTWGYIGPDTDGGMDLAASGFAFNNCYLKTAPTVTSDANEKTIIGSLADTTYADGQKLLAAADAVDAKVYQLNASIAEKGAANARWHIGYIAQEWETALTNAGLDAGKMGLLISYPLTEQQEKTATDADGKTVTYYETVPVYEADGKTQKTGYMLRYDELQCLLLEARKQKQIALEARIAALEAKAGA